MTPETAEKLAAFGDRMKDARQSVSEYDIETNTQPYYEDLAGDEDCVESATVAAFQKQIANIVESQKIREIEASRDWWRNAAWAAMAVIAIQTFCTIGWVAK